MQTEIKRWGNSAAVRLSSKVLAQSRLTVSSAISIEVDDGKIIIEAADRQDHQARLPFSEADLLRGLDAHGVHGDELAEPAAGEMEY